VLLNRYEIQTLAGTLTPVGLWGNFLLGHLLHFWTIDTLALKIVHIPQLCFTTGLPDGANSNDA